MSTTPENAPKPRPAISLPFLVFAAILLVGGYFGGFELMKRNFYNEEESKKKSDVLTMPKDVNLSVRPNLAGGAPPSDSGPKDGERSRQRPGQGDSEEEKDETTSEEPKTTEEPRTAEEPKATEEPKASESGEAAPAGDTPKDGGAAVPADQPAPPPVENPGTPTEGSGEKSGGGNS